MDCLPIGSNRRIASVRILRPSSPINIEAHTGNIFNPWRWCQACETFKEAKYDKKLTGFTGGIISLRYSRIWQLGPDHSKSHEPLQTPLILSQTSPAWQWHSLAQLMPQVLGGQTDQRKEFIVNDPSIIQYGRKIGWLKAGVIVEQRGILRKQP